MRSGGEPNDVRRDEPATAGGPRRAAAVFGAAMVVVVAAIVGLIGQSRSSSARVGTVVSATPTTLITPTTCLPIGFDPVPAPSAHLVTVDTPGVVTVLTRDNGTHYDVPVGTTFAVELVMSQPPAGSCAASSPSRWTPPIASPSKTIRANSTNAPQTAGSVTASFTIVGAGVATITSDAQPCAGCPFTHWEVTIRVGTSPTTSTLPRTT